VEELRELSLMLVAFHCNFCDRSVHADRIVLRPKRGEASTNSVDCPRCGAEMEPRFAPMRTIWDGSSGLAHELTRREALEASLQLGLSRTHSADNLGTGDLGTERHGNWGSVRPHSAESKREQDVGTTTERVRSGTLNRLLLELIRGIRDLFRFRRS
jgi:hypothetical protein